MAIAILVPTVHRAEKLGPLLENIHEATASPHCVYFIAEETDTETFDVLEKLREPRMLAVIGDFGSCAKAMNVGYHSSTESYVFTGNDDLRFHPGWDTEALKVGKPVVGTNDGHRRMTCFALVERDFIETHSGVYDKPNTLFHEYESQYVDTELANYARARGVWGEAPLAFTEHLHWEFGKADQDHPNYQKAAATCAADHAVYLQRKRAWEESLSRVPLASSVPTLYPA